MLPTREAVTVPEVTVDENYNSGAWEDNVWLTRQFFCMFTESIAPFMKFGTDDFLKPGIFPLDLGHAVAALGWC